MFRPPKIRFWRNLRLAPCLNAVFDFLRQSIEQSGTVIGRQRSENACIDGPQVVHAVCSNRLNESFFSFTYPGAQHIILKPVFVELGIKKQLDNLRLETLWK